MNTVVNNFFRFLESVVQGTRNFDETTWGVLAVVTVVFGYFLLRGNLVR